MLFRVPKVMKRVALGEFPASVKADGGRVVYWPTPADPPRFDAVANLARNIVVANADELVAIGGGARASSARKSLE